METANFFWHGEKLSLYEQVCLTSFLKMGFKVIVWSYDYIHLPEGVKLQNAQSILSQEHLTKYTQDGRDANLAAFSDVFRVTLTNKRLGEWWFDMDCICLKNAGEFAKLKIDRDIVIGWEDNIYANGAVLSILNNNIAAEITNMQKKLCDSIKDIPWGTIGPKLLTNFCAKVGIQDQIFPIETFYPVHYTQTSFLFDKEKCFYVENLCKNSYTCHIWNEMLNRNNINKNEYPPVGSFLYNIFNEQAL